MIDFCFAEGAFFALSCLERKKEYEVPFYLNFF